MKYLRQGLAALLALAVVVRLAAWLLAPALPSIAILMFVVTLLSLMMGRSRE